MAQKNAIEYSGASWTGLFAAAPVTGDTASVGVDASQVISTNMDQSAVDLNGLTFQHPSRLRIGSAAGPLKYEMSGPLRWDQGGGHLYFEISTSAAPQIVVSGPNCNLVGGGTATLIEVSDRGGLFVSEDVTLTAVNMYGGGYAEIEAKSGDDFTAIITGGGEMLTRRNATTVDIAGGTFRTEDGAVTVTTATVREGGKFYHSGGTITTLNVYAGGVFDAMTSQVPFTVTTLNLSDNGVVNIPSWVTVSTTNYLGKRASL